MAATENDLDRLGHYIEDPQFIENNRTIYAHFVKRLADFTAFDANLDATFAANWKDAIDIFEAHPTDELMQKEIQDKANDVTKQKQAALPLVVDLEYYAKRAFPKNKSKLREFGFTETRTEMKSGIFKMVANLFILSRIGGDYNTELTAVGMSASVVTDLQAQAMVIAESELDHKYQKRQRIRSYEERVTKFNVVYGYFGQVREAAKVIYREQPETKKLFEMFRGEG